jgi:hypothetical protein
MLVDVPKPKAGSGQDKVGGAKLCHTDLALMRRKKALHALALGIERIGLVSLRFPLAVALVVIALAGFARRPCISRCRPAPVPAPRQRGSLSLAGWACWLMAGAQTSGSEVLNEIAFFAATRGGGRQERSGSASGICHSVCHADRFRFGKGFSVCRNQISVQALSTLINRGKLGFRLKA